MFPRRRPVRTGLLRMSGVSLGIHAALIILFSLNPLPSIVRAKPEVYAVTLMPVSLAEAEKTSLPPAVKQPVKPVEKPKRDDVVEKVKPRKKEEAEKEESLKNLQEAMEEIRKRAAIEEIQKNVARRERVERTMVASTGPPAPSASEIESKLNEYYGRVWAKIKEAWTIPENLLKEMVDLETVVIIVIDRDGKVRKMWFEKRSSSPLYDQMAMRAIKKAEPLPPVPRDFEENTLEIGIRFLPD